MTNRIPVEELDKETMQKLGIELPPSFGEVGSNLLVLSRLFNAIKDLDDEESLRVLHQVQMYILSRKNAPDKESVQLPDDAVPESYAPPIDWTLQVTAKVFGLNPVKLKHRTRDPLVVQARQAAIYVLYLTSKYTLAAIGEGVGGRSPATVSYAFSRIGNQITHDLELRTKVQDIQKLI